MISRGLLRSEGGGARCDRGSLVEISHELPGLYDCIGQHLAMAELTAVLPALTRRGDVTIDGTITEDPSFALRIQNGLYGHFTATRHDPGVYSDAAKQERPRQ